MSRLLVKKTANGKNSLRFHWGDFAFFFLTPSYSFINPLFPLPLMFSDPITPLLYSATKQGMIAFILV